MCTGEVRRALISQGMVRKCMPAQWSQQPNTTWVGIQSACCFTYTWPDCNVKPEVMQEDVDLILCVSIGT